jgi:predicted Zn-ribbon and HTH transcriptional regulator
VPVLLAVTLNTCDSIVLCTLSIYAAQAKDLENMLQHTQDLEMQQLIRDEQQLLLQTVRMRLCGCANDSVKILSLPACPRWKLT